MEGHIHIQPRQSGKTTTIINSFLEHPENTIIIVNNYDMFTHIKRQLMKYNNYNECVFVPNDYFYEKMLHKEIKRILIDDYLFFDYKKKIIVKKLIYFLNLESCSIYTTPNRKYNSDDIKYIRFIKKYRIPYKIINKKWCDNETIKELWINLLTDPTFKIHEWKEEERMCLKKEEFETEILGELYK